MKKIKLFGVIVSMLMVFSLAGCGGSSVESVDEADLIGVWGHGTGDTLSMNISGLTGTYIAFTEDGLMSTASERERLFSDEFNNSNLFTFSEPNIITIGSNEYTVSIDGNRLTIERDGSERTFQRVGDIEEDEEPTEEETAAPTEAEETPDDSADNASNGTEDWQQFLEDYDAFMTRFIADPSDLTLLTESIEWVERAAEIQAGLNTEDALEFSLELLRIAERALD